MVIQPMFVGGSAMEMPWMRHGFARDIYAPLPSVVWMPDKTERRKLKRGVTTHPGPTVTTQTTEMPATKAVKPLEQVGGDLVSDDDENQYEFVVLRPDPPFGPIAEVHDGNDDVDVMDDDAVVL